MESLGLGGVSATDRLVIVSDKSRDGRLDIWRCLDAGTGAPMWNLSYPAPGKMDYGSAPRASPVIVGETAYLLGALGHLYAAEVRTGRALWHCNLPQKFGGKVPQWGFAATPLVVDNKVVVTTGSPLASLAALDCRTGAVVWAAPGNPPGYGNFIVATLGGRRQLVGHDAATLGGWDPATGRRLWTLTPPERHDFNVPTPVAIGGKLLVATENNGTRLYSFDSGGHIVPLPVAIDRDLRPQTPSPVVVDGMVWCGSDSGLYCLDLGAGLSKVWSSEERPFTEHVSLIGGNGHVLVATKDGHVVLFPARPPAGYIPNSVNVLPDRPPDSDVAFWSHPALVGSRLYLRSNSELICLSLAL